MPNTRKILIADPDLPTVRALARGLRQQGYQVAHAQDGSRALELSVLRHPEVILFDEDCPLIDARRFVQILQANPRTADIPVVLTMRGADPDRARAFREGFLAKPYNLDEVLSRIDHLCRRVEAARELKGDAREIEGGLGQLPLADLLQILSMNRRTGRLVLGNGAERGEIHLWQGSPVNAHTGEAEGEKALFRLITWKEGTFAFAPGEAPAKKRIQRSMEDALLEGARQADERARLLDGAPALTQRLSVQPEAPAPVDPHPVTLAVLEALQQPRSLLELLDVVDAPDLEILSAARSLFERGVVALSTAPGSGPEVLLTPAEVHALRGRLLHGRPTRAALVVKVVVCGSTARAGRAVLKGLPGLVAVATEPGCLRSGFGTLGRLEVSDALKLDFVMLPTAEAARPLWRPFSSQALGALVADSAPATTRLARFLAFELKVPVSLLVGPGLADGEQLPAELRGAPAGASVVERDVAGAVRTLLLAALRPVMGEAHGTVVRRDATADPLTPFGGAR